MSSVKLFMVAFALIFSWQASAELGSSAGRFGKVFPERSPLPHQLRKAVIDHLKSECPGVKQAEYKGTQVFSEVDEYSDAWRKHLYKTTLDVSFYYDFEGDNAGTLVFNSVHDIDRATGEEFLTLQSVVSENPTICYKADGVQRLFLFEVLKE